MSRVAIAVEGLGKQYRLGQTRDSYRTLRDAVAAAARRRSRARPGTIWALRDVSFEVEQGEAVGIIGPNGAGKSTLLKILSRITEPTAGTARVRGRVGSLLEVGTGFHLELTGRENIYLNGAILGMRKAEIERQLDAIVAFAEVERFLDTPVKRYSTGMYVRLAFAVAAHLNADVLLVDEVLSVGDLAFQRKCLDKMQDQTATEGRTVLFVSHNLASIKLLTERCVWLDRGSIRSIGPTEEVFRAYVLSHAEGIEAGSADYSDLTFGRPGHKMLVHDLAFRTITLRNSAGEITEVHLGGEPIAVEIVFGCLVPRFERPLKVMSRLRTLEGVVVWTTTSHFGEVSLTEGLYRTSYVIEPNLFAAGTYQLSLTLDSGFAQDFLPVAMRFRIEANPAPGEEAEYVGIVHVDLPWEPLERVEQRDPAELRA